MSEDEGKREFLRSVTLLGAFCSMKEKKPTTREELEKDRQTNENIRTRAIQIRQHKYFKNLIFEGKTHEDFLDVWEALEFFVNKWSYGYRVLNDVEWKEEDNDLWGISKALHDTKIV